MADRDGLHHKTFLLLLAMVTIGAVVLVVQARTRWLRLREQQLSRLVAERTAELETLSAALAQKSLVLERASISDRSEEHTSELQSH